MHSPRGGGRSILIEMLTAPTKDTYMTSWTSTPLRGLGRADLDKTRSRFVLARAQAGAHGSAADNRRIREMSRWTPFWRDR